MNDMTSDWTDKPDLYRLLVENTVDCIWLYDLDNQCFKYISPSVFQLRGLTVEEALQERLEDCLTPDSLATIKSFARHLPVPVESGGVAFIHDYRLRCKDGSIKPVEISTRLIVNHETGAVSILGVSRDISLRKPIEELLQHEVVEKDEEIRKLMATQADLVKLTSEVLEKNESLRRLALTDELTGLSNRYYFDRRVEEEIERADRYDSPLSLILFDLDHFKDVNDLWGHDAGDQVLVSVTRYVKQIIRKPDILARWGGEEFILLAPQTSLDGVAVLAEKLRQAISSGSHGEASHVTASFGLAERLKGESFGSWFRRADEALYQAKRSGRDCVYGRANDLETPVAQIRLEWKKVWECGHAKIDKQHQKVIDLANSLIDQSLISRGSEQMNALFNQLIEHITNHFADEEKILHEIAYPELAMHVSRHRNLSRKLLRLNNNYLKAELKPSALFSYIVDDVVVGHLLTDDVLFFPYIRIQGGDANGSQGDH